MTIAGDAPCRQPFIVMATQNPIEHRGHLPAAEAQVDRFMMKVLVGYPSEEEEFVIVAAVTGAAIAGLGGRDHRAASACSGVPAGYADPALIQLRVKLVAATRDPARHGLAQRPGALPVLGASPRASSTHPGRQGARVPARTAPTCCPRT